MKKLPLNVFADSPLRSTDGEKPDAPKGKGARSKATLKVASAPAVDTDGAAPKDADDVNRPQTRKLTVYLPEESVQAIDDEVYRRRKAGDRSFSFADMHRELVEEWVARQAKRTRVAGS